MVAMPLLAKLCSLLALAVATASPLGAHPPSQNLPNGQVGWATEPTPGGANATLRGTTFQASRARPPRHNPNHERELAARQQQHQQQQQHERRRRRRSPSVPETKCCSPDANYAQPGPVADAVAYLRNHYSSAWNDAGSCGRVSCSYGAAVYWCNDTGSLKSIDWNDLADAVQAIADGCGRRSVGVCGSREPVRGVRIIVGGDVC